MTRVIARLDLKPSIGVVKGRRFEGLRRVGDPRELAARYVAQRCDELLIVDTTASLYGRQPPLELVRYVCEELYSPVCVAGGIRSFQDFKAATRAGAGQAAMNTAALKNPELITACAEAFGSQAVVLSLEVKRETSEGFGQRDGDAISRENRGDGGGSALRDPTPVYAYSLSGREPSGREAVAWAVEAVERGAGEILVTSVDRDGTGLGYDLELLAALHAVLPTTPVVASGGLGTPADAVRAIAAGADAVAVGAWLHGGGTVGAIKAALVEAGVEVRT